MRWLAINTTQHTFVVEDFPAKLTCASLRQVGSSHSFLPLAFALDYFSADVFHSTRRLNKKLGKPSD